MACGFNGTERMLATMEEAVFASDPEGVFAYDAPGRLGEIRIPTPVVAGRRDDVIPIARSELLRDGIPRAE
jgi:pimeloyl-ACP methyl ester carboxylesterase